MLTINKYQIHELSETQLEQLADLLQDNEQIRQLYGDLDLRVNNYKELRSISTEFYLCFEQERIVGALYYEGIIGRFADARIVLQQSKRQYRLGLCPCVDFLVVAPSHRKCHIEEKLLYAMCADFVQECQSAEGWRENARAMVQAIDRHCVYLMCTAATPVALYTQLGFEFSDRVLMVDAQVDFELYLPVTDVMSKFKGLL